MADKSKVSIIVPVYNAENYIDSCIRSILTQTYSEIEIILVNDCSTDKSLALCKGWSERDERVRVFSLERNSGPAAARNRGIKEAHGDYITFVDADDWIEKECVEGAIEAAKVSGADIVHWNLIFQHGNSQSFPRPLKGEERLFAGDEIKNLQEMILLLQSETGDLVTGIAGPYCKLFRVELIKDIAFPENMHIGEDVCFTMQAFQAAKSIQYINQHYYHHVYYKTSLSHRFDLNYVDVKVKSINWLLEYCQKNNICSSELLNQFIYINLKETIHYYMHVMPSVRQIKCYDKIRSYPSKVTVPLDWDKVDEPDKKAKRLIGRGWYWRYKVYFVFSNIWRAI